MAQDWGSPNGYARLAISPFSFGGVKKAQDSEIAAVPAAIQAVLHAIDNGAKFIVRSDIEAFFTKIPKPAVTAIVSEAVQEPEFVELFPEAITVELKNMAQLREEDVNRFPIQEIGVAQGNSLSPLLGNLYLADFDSELNRLEGIVCLRYIDDFIILGPDRQTAARAFDRAKSILGIKGLTVSDAKTDRRSVSEGFEFLGIELSNGFIRPAKDAQKRLLSSIEMILNESRNGLREYNRVGKYKGRHSFLDALNHVRGVIHGWGKHYRFCNDSKCFEQLDKRIGELIKAYFAAYGEERAKADEKGQWGLLGMESIASIERKPFDWPKKRRATDPGQRAVPVLPPDC